MMKKSSNGILKKEITSSDIDFSDNNIQGAFRWSGKFIMLLDAILSMEAIKL